MQRTTTSSPSFEASELNRRTDAAQVPVSILGKIFRTSFFPAKSAAVLSDRSPAVSLKPGSFDPTAGNLPIVLNDVPLSVTVDIMVSPIKSIKLIKLGRTFKFDQNKTPKLANRSSIL